MNRYELLFILKPTFTEAEANDVAADVKTVIEAEGGKVLEDESWGKRSLAYEIDGFGEGFYFIWTFELSPGNTSILRRGLKINEGVLRFLILSR